MAKYSLHIYAINITITKSGVAGIADQGRLIGAVEFNNPSPLQMVLQGPTPMEYTSQEHPHGIYDVCFTPHLVCATQEHPVIEHTVEHPTSKVTIE